VGEDFLSLYQRHAGKSEIPPQYHRWAGISLVAGCLSDRVMVERHKDAPMPVNLYVYLVGSSGTGKEKAISTAIRYASGVEGVDLLAGRATGAALLKYLQEHPKLYFVTEELGMSVRAGEQADDLIKIMTALYSAHGYPVGDVTIARGERIVVDHCVNWLAGTTEEWLIRSISRDAIEGGFFARVIPVLGRKDYTIRYPKIQYPPDYQHLKALLRARVEVYASIEGVFQLSEDATALHDKWYRTLAPPTEKALEPSFNRADEMVHKLAAILEVMAWDPADRQACLSPMIQATTLQAAVQLWEETLVGLPTIIKAASSTTRSLEIELVWELIQRMPGVTFPELLRRVGNRGLDREALRRALGTLQEREDVVRVERRYYNADTVNGPT
jgi:hypothetical protein